MACDRSLRPQVPTIKVIRGGLAGRMDAALAALY
jgi:hypothetical protein